MVDEKLKATFACPLDLKLGGGQYCFAHGCRKLNERKVVCREKIVFPRLINDAQLLVFSCVKIG